MRSFRHLTTTEIREIIVLHNDGITQAELSRRFNVDHSTINYHLTKYQRSYPEGGGIYALIKIDVKKTCFHPSGKCTLCGEMWDEIRRGELDQIAALKRQITDLQSTLRVHGLLVE